MGSKRIRVGDLVHIDHPKAGEFLASVEGGEQGEGGYWTLELGPAPPLKRPPPRVNVSTRYVQTLYRKAGKR